MAERATDPNNLPNAEAQLEECFMSIFTVMVNQENRQTNPRAVRHGERQGIPIYDDMPAWYKKKFTFQELQQKAPFAVQELGITGEAIFEASDAYYFPKSDNELRYQPPQVTIGFTQGDGEYSCMINLLANGNFEAQVHDEDAIFDPDAGEDAIPAKIEPPKSRELYLMTEMTKRLFCA